MRLLLLADTHLPTRAKDLPVEVLQEVEAADAVLQAGDWVSVDLLERLCDRSRRLVGCYGNNDGPDLRARLPLVHRVELEGVRFIVVHETGGKSGREQRAAAEYPDDNVLVFGHSHIPWYTTATNRPGVRLLQHLD